MNCWGVLPAAGSGARFGSEVPKQYLPLNGRAVLSWSVAALLAAPVKALAIPLGPGDRHWQSLGLDDDPRIRVCRGGATRQQSVLAGLNALTAGKTKTGRNESAAAWDWVLVHDAVRPCVRAGDIARLLADTAASGADGGLLGWPVVNALKRVAPNMAVRKNVARENCWNAATPQMFRFGVLLDALKRAEAEGSSHVDEAAAVIAAGGKVVMVDGAKDNIKITHKPDLALVGAILGQLGEEIL